VGVSLLLQQVTKQQPSSRKQRQATSQQHVEVPDVAVAQVLAAGVQVTTAKYPHSYQAATTKQLQAALSAALQQHHDVVVP
jgi:hypothetical protein